MSSIENTIKTFDERESVTTISANARIDYILRFSKHAVLVIDDDPEVYSNVGNEFLASLSQDDNAAFVSITSKLNDIQIRCRIIEQLFGNSLFDPEQPLSVNVVKLSEAKNVAITIVIGNAEFLSIQITHELCQLAEVAKKLNKTINVLLLGKVQAAINLSENTYLFDNKISILLAKSGQLIGLNSLLLKKTSAITFNKISIIVLILLVSFVFIIYIFTQDVFFKKSTEQFTHKAVEEIEVVDEYKKDFVNITNSKEEMGLLDDKDPDELIATPKEVFELLNVQFSNIVTKKGSVNRENVEVAPLISANTKEKTSDISETGPTNKRVNELNDDSASKILNVEVLEEIKHKAVKQLDAHSRENYYQEIKQGFIVQLASFEKLAGFNSFLNTYKNNTLYGYTRSLNGKVTYIVTTQVYQTNIQAKSAINGLSQDLRQRGPWIKSLQAVNNEIKLYQQSR